MQDNYSQALEPALIDVFIRHSRTFRSETQ